MKFSVLHYCTALHRLQHRARSDEICEGLRNRETGRISSENRRISLFFLQHFRNLSTVFDQMKVSLDNNTRLVPPDFESWVGNFTVYANFNYTQYNTMVNKLSCWNALTFFLSISLLYVNEGAGIACWLKRRTRDRKIASSNPGRSSRRIFFSRVNFVC